MTRPVAAADSSEKHTCTEKVYDNRAGSHACGRTGTMSRGGRWYCWQHDPEHRQLDREAREAKYQQKLDVLPEACSVVYSDRAYVERLSVPFSVVEAAIKALEQRSR